MTETIIQKKPSLKLSEKVEGIPEALSVYLNNLIYQMKRRGERITTLSLGEAYFDLPFFGFEEEDIKTGYHYSESRGIPELRDCIAGHYNNTYGANVDPEEEVLISAGSKPLIFMTLQAILNPGDEVLIHEPAWLSYPEQIRLAGGVPVFIPYNVTPRDFSKYVTDKTKAIIINNPNNPAGVSYPEEDLAVIYQTMRERGAYTIVDEAYSDFVTADEFTSIAALEKSLDGVIVVNSLSKNLGISGWRVGYIISTPQVVYAVLKLNQHLLTCASTLLLKYLARNFDNLLEATIPQARRVVSDRLLIRRYIEDRGMKTLGGESTFYLFVDISKYGRPSLDLAMHLLMKYKIGVVPGSAYGKSTDGFIRIGIGAEPLEDVKSAIDTILDVVNCGEYDEELVLNGLKELGAEPFVSCVEEGR